MNPQNYQNNSNFSKVHVEQQLKILTEREIQWTVGYLKNKHWDITIPNLVLPDPSHPVGTNNLRNYVSDFIFALGEQIGGFEITTLLKDRATRLVPEQEIEWLKSDMRAQIFAYFFLKESYQSTFETFYENTCLGYIYSFLNTRKTIIPTVQSTLIANIINTEDKTLLIRNMESKWKEIINIVNYEKWIEKEDDKYVDWIHGYMKKKLIAMSFLNSGLDRDLKSEEILAVLDFFDWNFIYKAFPQGTYIPSEGKLRFIEKMKAALSQQKYRDAGKTKSQYHLPLTKTDKARLDKIARVQNTTSTEILHLLINAEYERNYIDEKGKDKY